VHSLEKQMKALQSNFEFAYYPGDHWTLFTTEYRKDGNQFLQQKYVEWRSKSKTGKN
jgi:hypothetical protein